MVALQSVSVGDPQDILLVSIDRADRVLPALQASTAKIEQEVCFARALGCETDKARQILCSAPELQSITPAALFQRLVTLKVSL